LAIKRTTGKKQSAKEGGADKQRGEQRKQPRGRPFEKGNKFSFMPGQSGNPRGRPKSVKFLSEAYREWLGAPSRKDPERTNADMLAEVIGQQALAGDIAAAREIGDRAEGRPRQSVALDAEQVNDQRRREWALEQLQRVMERLGSSREAAIEWMKAHTPTAAQWIN
jgi:hypothetical protein